MHQETITAPFYRHALKRALTTTLKHKQFWILGVLAAALSPYLSVIQILSNNYTLTRFGGTGLVTQSLFPFNGLINTCFEYFVRAWQSPLWASMWALGLVALLAVFTWTTVTARNMVITRIRHARRATWSGLFAHAQERFWGTTTIALVGKALLTILSLALAASAYAIWSDGSASEWGRLGFFLGLIAFTILSLLTAFVIIFTTFAYLDGISLKKSIIGSLRVFRSHWIVCIEMALLLYIIQFAGTIALGLAVVAIGIPVALLLGIFSTLSFTVISGVTLALCFIALLASVIIFGGAFAVYELTLWSEVYDHMHGGVMISKLRRIFAPLWHKS